MRTELKPRDWYEGVSFGFKRLLDAKVQMLIARSKAPSLRDERAPRMCSRWITRQAYAFEYSGHILATLPVHRVDPWVNLGAVIRLMVR